MPKLIITDRSGKKSEIEYDSNFTLMETLRDNGYDIEASCGGCCACDYLVKLSFPKSLMA